MKGKMKPKQKIIFTTLGICILLLLIAIFILVPSLKEINKLKDNVNIIQQELENKYFKTQRLRRSLQELDKIKKETNEFKMATVEKGEELQIITELENLANKNNIDQTLNVSFSEENKAYTFSFLNNGYFEHQINYLNDLQRLPYYVIIENTYWEKRQKNTDNNQNVSLRFDGIIYAKTN